MYINLVYIIIIYVFRRKKQLFQSASHQSKEVYNQNIQGRKIYTLQRKISSDTNIHGKLSTAERATTAGKLRRVSRTVGFEIF